MKQSKPRYLNAMAALVFLAAACAFAPQVAWAQSLIDGSDPQAVLNVARGYGSADLDTDSGGDPRIKGRIEGISYTLNFYGCSSGRNCKSLTFYAGWVSDRVSLREINEWNRTKRFSRAYLDHEDDPIVELDVNLDGGVSRRNLDDTFDWWKVTVTAFKRDLNL